MEFKLYRKYRYSQYEMRTTYFVRLIKTKQNG